MSTVDPKLLEQTIAAKLLGSVKEKGAAAAASQLREIMEAWQSAQASAEHQVRMKSLKDDPIGLCEYLGELGFPKGDIPLLVGGPMDARMREAHKIGALRRVAEARALQLARARGGDRIESWMLKE